ncbi:hypothetical protein GCM10009792_25760 [Microcella alkalica]|uniref:Uncharacterized protein n=1 Tax=Microcella alkalica TaxID=355930 RepID=A0A839E4W9_9MICO|nr:hypothetical protein [Microcella alkalica]MBA8847719.1 hypothetical protein [Microcella alkalica]
MAFEIDPISKSAPSETPCHAVAEPCGVTSATAARGWARPSSRSALAESDASPDQLVMAARLLAA